MKPEEISAFADAILALVAFLGAIGACIGFFRVRHEIQQQRKDTENLTRLTARLEHRIQVLSAELNQSIRRLERASELIRMIHEGSFWIIFESTRSQDSDVSSRLTSHVAEFKALTVVLKDDKLKALGDEMSPTFALEKNPNAPWTLKEPIGKMDDLMERIHIRIYELLEEITARNSLQGDKR